MKLFIFIWLFIVGAVMGSFLACMGYRIPNKIKTTFPSSFCPNCKNSLKWYMNIPIVSYLFLKGKCYFCKKKIGAIYFLCELVCPILYVCSYLLFGFSYNCLVSIILSSMLITIIISDYLYYYISDRVLVIGGILILICNIYFNTTTQLCNNVISGIILFLLMLGLKLLGNSIFKKESLGDGDIKLMAVIGLALGLLGSFVSLFFASLLALIYGIIVLCKDKNNVIPFGPFIVIGAIIVLFFSSYIIPYLETLFSI